MYKEPEMGSWDFARRTPDGTQTIFPEITKMDFTKRLDTKVKCDMI